MDVREKKGLTPAFQTDVYSDIKMKVKILPTTFFKILDSLYVFITYNPSYG